MWAENFELLNKPGPHNQPNIRQVETDPLENLGKGNLQKRKKMLLKRNYPGEVER